MIFSTPFWGYAKYLVFQRLHWRYVMKPLFGKHVEKGSLYAVFFDKGHFRGLPKKDF